MLNVCDVPQGCVQGSMFNVGRHQCSRRNCVKQLVYYDSPSICLSLFAIYRPYCSIVKTAPHRNIGFPRGLKPVSRHATATIITGQTFMRKRLCSFIDDFHLYCAALLMMSRLACLNIVTGTLICAISSQVRFLQPAHSWANAHVLFVARMCRGVASNTINLSE